MNAVVCVKKKTEVLYTAPNIESFTSLRAGLCQDINGGSLKKVILR